MAYGFKISDACVGCGMCFSSRPDLFKENQLGTAMVIDGAKAKDELEANSIIKICPEHAINIEKISGNDKQLAVSILEKIKNFSGCTLPTMKDIPFVKEEYSIDIPVASGEYRYEYSSDTTAEKAGLREFDSKMFSQIDNYILKIVTQYRVKHIKPYYSKEITEGSVYAKTNQQLAELLKSLKDFFGSSLLSDFDSVEVFPEKDTYWKMLNKGEILSDEMIPVIKRHFDQFLSDYECYIDSDDREVSAGTDLRGNTKYKDKYCYCHINQAFESLADDILSSCYYADDKIQERAFEIIKVLVDEYNKELEGFIKDRVQIAEREINKMSVAVNERPVLQKYDDVLRYIRLSEGKIKVNGNTIDEAEAFVTQSIKGEQFVYDGKDIYKVFIQGNIKHKEKMFPREQYKYYDIVGYKGKIIFEAKYGEMDGVMTYDTNSSKLDVIEKDEVFGMCIVGEKLCYSTIQGWNRMGTKYIYSCDLDGGNKQLVTSVYGGGECKMIYDFEEREGKLHYRVSNISTSRDEEFDVDLDNVQGSFKSSRFSAGIFGGMLI